MNNKAILRVILLPVFIFYASTLYPARVKYKDLKAENEKLKKYIEELESSIYEIGSHVSLITNTNIKLSKNLKEVIEDSKKLLKISNKSKFYFEFLTGASISKDNSKDVFPYFSVNIGNNFNNNFMIGVNGGFFYLEKFYFTAGVSIGFMF